MSKIKLLGIAIIAILFQSNISKAQNSTEAESIKWMTFEQAVEQNAKNPKKVFIDVYTDWCGWCKRMDAVTFAHPEIVKYMNKNFYAVKFNAEQKGTISFKGTDFINPNPENPRSAHQLAAALLKGRMGYPSVVFMDENMNLINVVAGYQQPADMEKLLKYHAENEYTKRPWDEFLNTFVGEIK